VADLVLSTGRTSGVVVSSFWPGALAAVRRVAPGVRTGLLLASRFDPAAGVSAAVRLGCQALHPHVELISPALVEEAHRAGLSVAAWTVNDRSRLEGARDAGVDTVITDDVALALATLATGRTGA
jgi:glycerophosphoryl diester phosphodiesterase